MMKILYITQYYYPEVCAPVNRARANAEKFAQKGHHVTIVTEMPNHPQGVVFDGYKRKIYVREKIRNCNVSRVWVYTSRKKNFITRILFYLSFALSASIYSLFNIHKYDLVYISSPPLFVSLIGLIIKTLYPQKKIIFEVRDLWPDSAIQLGEIKNQRIIELSEKLELSIYQISERIVAISEHMKDIISEKGIPQEKIAVVHNGTDFRYDIQNLLKEKIEEYSILKDKKIILYAGNIGIAQNIEVILEAADELRNEKNFHFFIIGDGPRKDELQEIKRLKNLDNVEFLGEISRDRISGYLSQAHCGIVPLKKLPLFYGALPSKIFDYMACGLPLLVGIDGEAKALIEDSKTGYYFEPENAHDLAQKLQLLLQDAIVLNQFSDNAIKFVKEHFTRDELTNKLEKEILQEKI